MAKRIFWTIIWHGNRAKKPSKAFRKWDGKTPYGIHPAWCAMTLLHETTLPEEVRNIGYQALLYHDILEDTDAKLPEDFPNEASKLVEEMTFESSDIEMVEIWSKSKEAKLLKLYDKVSNLLDGAWMSAEKRAKYSWYTLRLADEVGKNFGQLNIVKIARVIAQ